MKHYRPTNILVTGVAGFIGSNFSHYFLRHYNSCNLVGLDKLTYAGTEAHCPKHLNFKFIKGDICNQNLIARILDAYNIDTIVHFAAESHVDRSIHNPEQFIQTNIVGTFSLLQTAHDYWKNNNKLNPHCCRFYHISTDEVYGQLATLEDRFTEQTAYHPNSPYAASKASADHLVRSFQHTYNLPTVISNCSNNFGPYQHTEKLIPKIIFSCLNNLPIPLYGDGSHIRDWLYVQDHCAAIDIILHNGKIGETYNIGSNTELSNLELTNIICTQLNIILKTKYDFKKLITFVLDRPGHDWRYALDASKLKRELGWKPQYTFEEALAQTLHYYLHQHKQKIPNYV